MLSKEQPSHWDLIISYEYPGRVMQPQVKLIFFPDFPFVALFWALFLLLHTVSEILMQKVLALLLWVHDSIGWEQDTGEGHSYAWWAHVQWAWSPWVQLLR